MKEVTTGRVTDETPLRKANPKTRIILRSTVKESLKNMAWKTGDFK